MIPKYKLSDVAKDFGSTVQEVGAVLEGVSEGAKKPNTVLTEEEFSMSKIKPGAIQEVDM